MAILFNSATPDYYSKTFDSVSKAGHPFTVAAWFTVPSISQPEGLIFSSSDGATDNERYSLGVVNNSIIWSAQSGGIRSAIKAGVVAGQWHSAIGIEAHDRERHAILDGVRATDTSLSGANTNNGPKAAIGCFPGPITQSRFFNGSIAYVTVFLNYAFTDEDAAGWHAGRIPTGFTKLPSFVWPCNGNGPITSRVRDIIGVSHIDETISGTPTKVESRPLIRNVFMQGCG